MFSLFFSIPNYVTIKISSNRSINFGHDEYLLLKGYVPGIIKLDSEPDNVDFTIEHTESKDKKFIKKDNCLYISDIWEEKFSPDLYHLLYGIVRLQLLEKNLFSVHGACVGKDDYILVIGHSGAGKTSAVLRLLEDKDIKIFSGNKTVVSFDSGILTAIAGTPIITIRGNDKDKLDELKVGDYVENWGRYAFILNSERYESRKSVKIKAVVLIRLNDYTEESTKIESVSALHHLYPFFLDAVNADIIMNSIENVFIGTPPEEIKKYLVIHLKNVLMNMPVYSFIGSSTFVADQILKL